jgi:AcrR family transcriptional regulator
MTETVPTAQPPAGRRERKKAATRQAIADAALALFLEHGYHEVSVKQIADAADVSVTTLFTYFPDGKEALVFDQDRDREAQLVAIVRDRPAGQPILDALRDGFLAGQSREEQGASGQMRRFFELVENTPELSDYLRKMWLRHERALAQAIAEQAGTDPDDVTIIALAHFILETLILARRAGAGPRESLLRVFDRLKNGWGDLGA